MDYLGFNVWSFIVIQWKITLLYRIIISEMTRERNKTLMIFRGLLSINLSIITYVYLTALCLEENYSHYVWWLVFAIFLGFVDEVPTRLVDWLDIIDCTVCSIVVLGSCLIELFVWYVCCNQGCLHYNEIQQLQWEK